MVQVISGSSNIKLARELANFLGTDLIRTKIDSFCDGELKVQILDPISSKVIIVQSTSHPVNDHLMELLLLADTVNRAGAKDICAIIPYFGYSRQDRHTYNYGPISASLVAKLLEASGITKIITLDLHSQQLEGFFDIPVINLDSSKLLLPYFQNRQDIMVVSPDIGGITRARNFCAALDCGLAVINKKRDPDNNCSMSKIIGDVAGKDCLIIDDIVDSANTLCMAAELLQVNGAKDIEAYVTHAVLSKGAINKIEQSSLKKIYISDSIDYSKRLLPSKFIILPIGNFIRSSI